MRRSIARRRFLEQRRAAVVIETCYRRHMYSELFKRKRRATVLFQVWLCCQLIPRRPRRVSKVDARRPGLCVCVRAFLCAWDESGCVPHGESTAAVREGERGVHRRPGAVPLLLQPLCLPQHHGHEEKVCACMRACPCCRGPSGHMLASFSVTAASLVPACATAIAAVAGTTSAGAHIACAAVVIVGVACCRCQVCHCDPDGVAVPAQQQEVPTVRRRGPAQSVTVPRAVFATRHEPKGTPSLSLAPRTLSACLRRSSQCVQTALWS